MKRELAATGAAVTTTAVLGGLAGGGSSAWFRQLDKPAFQPPPQVFPVVWTALYADIAVSTAAALSSARASRSTSRSLRGALALNLALNASWSWVFFRAHRLGGAAAVAGLLTVSSADLARRASSVAPRAGAALLPYAGWCAFATVLSASIARRNG
jgi:translocator protein